MFRLFDNANYDFLRLWRPAGIASAIFIVPGLLLLLVRGVNLSIEFTGGTFMQVRALTPDMRTATIRDALNAGGVVGAEIQTFGLTGQEFAIRARLDAEGMVSEAVTQETAAAVTQALTDAFGEGSHEILRRETVGPKVGSELRDRALLSLFLATGAIFLVIWFRYEWRFSLAAVMATVHDVLAALALIAYLNLEVSLVIVAALLLLLGYSLNDTIVTFDRVRENLRRYKRRDIYAILNQSVNETLPRTVLTSLTTLGSAFALLFLGGEVIRGFSIIITFGMAVGTYSTIYMAAAMLLQVERRWPGEDVRGAKAIAPTAAAAAT